MRISGIIHSVFNVLTLNFTRSSILAVYISGILSCVEKIWSLFSLTPIISLLALVLANAMIVFAKLATVGKVFLNSSVLLSPCCIYIAICLLIL
jgi:hypothetical protein